MVGLAGGVGSAGGSGVVGGGGTLDPSFFIPDFNAAIIAVLIDMGGEGVLVDSVEWLLVGGVLAVVGVAGAAAGVGEPGVKKCSVVSP